MQETHRMEAVILKRLKIVWRVVLLSVMYVFAFGNDTAMNNGIYGPEPMDVTQHHESQLRLMNEDLRIEFGEDSTWVQATFKFHNTNSERPVTQLTGFPDLMPEKGKDYNLYTYTSLGPLKDFSTKIDGKPVTSYMKYSYVRGEVDGYWIPVPKEKGERLGWHVVNLVAQPSGDVVLERRYRVSNGVFGTIGRSFLYVTHTGTAWQGTIGQLNLEVLLKDGLTTENLCWPERNQEPYSLTTKPEKRQWDIVAPDKMKLTWKDFEPRKEKNKSVFWLVTRFESVWIERARVLVVRTKENPIGYRNFLINDMNTGKKWTLQMKRALIDKLVKVGDKNDLLVGRYIQVNGNLLAPGIVRVSDDYYNGVELYK